MKISFKKDWRRQIEKARFECLNKMTESNIAKDRWDMLHARVRAYDEMLKPAFKISPDTIAMILANLAGIIIVLNFEKTDIIRSKAFGLVTKLKI